MQKYPGGLQQHTHELTCWARPHPRLPIINCLHTVTYPALTWCLENQTDRWSSTGAAQLEPLAAAVQQGRGAGQGTVGGQQVGVRYQSARRVRRRCGRRLGAPSVHSWVCAPSRAELVLQRWSLVPKGIVCENPEPRHARWGRALGRKLSFFSFFLTAHPSFNFLLCFCSLQVKFCFTVKIVSLQYSSQVLYLLTLFSAELKTYSL